MELLTLATKPDPKAKVREIASAAIKGAAMDPVQSAPVKLESWPEDGTTDEEKIKVAADRAHIEVMCITRAAKLRVDLASVNMGRFTVDLVDNIAWVTVSTKAARTRRKAVHGTETQRDLGSLSELSSAPPAAPKAAKKGAGK